MVLSEVSNFGLGNQSETIKSNFGKTGTQLLFASWKASSLDLLFLKYFNYF